MLPVAHRTPSDAGACAALVEAGAACFEIDVQLSTEGVVVSHWQPLLGVPGWPERDGLRLRLHRERSPDPLLADVLRNLPVSARVLLDPKETRADRRRALREQLTEQLATGERFVVSTDDAEDLQGYREAGFRTWRTVGDQRGLADVLAGAADVHQGLSIQHALVTPATADRLRAVSPVLVAWTVDTLGRAAELAALGVYGVTSNNPEVLSWVAGQPSGANRAG